MLELSSIAFENQGRIPALYTCRGKEISPPLQWKNAPKATKSFALLMDDVDTPLGVLNHWVLYNIPSDRDQLPEDIPHDIHLADTSVQGRNSMRRTGYMGPCPPWGVHRYVFSLYALDMVLEINPKMNKKKLVRAMQGHVIEQSQLIGLYSKQDSSSEL
ncbi:MAG: YbhB/YbcL family Raf kinase inhibitor-like protein [Candidatus Thermoplasmatota archaeon]|nr:YbhB/YbcL family Raf kinase inhibitor-like protein [Candidatus Thermoplasmatota archaeon]